MSKRLTYKQQLFVDYYEGNGTEACRRAGYKGSDNVLAQQAMENLRNPQIVGSIQQRYLNAHSGDIADRETRQEFWTTVMMNPDEPIQVRLKASEILGKSCGDFIARPDQGRNPFADFLDEVCAEYEPLISDDMECEKCRSKSM